MIAILVDPSPEGFLLDLYAVRSGYCHYAPSSPCFVADSSRRSHANSLPIGFCSSDAAVFSSANKQIGRGSGIVNTWYMTDGMRHLFGTEYRNLVLTKVG